MQVWTATENACLLLFIAKERETNTEIIMKQDLLVDMCQHPIFSTHFRTPAALRKHLQYLRSAVATYPDLLRHAASSSLQVLVEAWLSKHSNDGDANLHMDGGHEQHDVSLDDHSMMSECLEEWKHLTGLQYDDEPFRGRCGQQAWGLKEHVSAGQQFRQHMLDNTPSKVCACCARYFASKCISTHDINQLPNVSLLRCDGVKNAETPRHNHTKVTHAGVDYCMTSEGIEVLDKRPAAQVSAFVNAVAHKSLPALLYAVQFNLSFIVPSAVM